MLLSPASPAASFFTFRNLRPPKNMRKSRRGERQEEERVEGRSGVSGGWVDGISKDYRTIPFISPIRVLRCRMLGKGRKEGNKSGATGEGSALATQYSMHSENERRKGGRAEGTLR